MQEKIKQKWKIKRHTFYLIEYYNINPSLTSNYYFSTNYNFLQFYPSIFSDPKKFLTHFFKKNDYQETRFKKETLQNEVKSCFRIWPK